MVDPLWDVKEEIIRKWYVKGEPILDVGCGSGDFVCRFNEEKFGIDIDFKAIGIARKRGIKVLRKDLLKPFNLKQKFFNIFCLDVLEHLSDPRICLKSCYRHLKKEGRFFVSVPYFGLIKRLIVALFFFDRFFGYETSHVRFYSPNCMRNLLRETGFTIIKEYKIGRFWPVYMNILFVCTK
jgi:2-polyprenyl-3-methyl-5-hydroxy-6-metoxy-1,4-benzoquinol methylase